MTVENVDFAEFSRYQVQPKLTTLAIAHSNPDDHFIADDILPKALMVPTKEFQYSIFDEGDYLTIPETLVGRKGQPVMVDSGGTLITDSVLDYGLQDTIPMDDIHQEQGAFMNQQRLKTMQLTELIMLDREKRVAEWVADNKNYASSLGEDVAGDTWDNDTINPVKLIQQAMTKTFIKPNIGVTSTAGWATLRANPFIVSAVQANDGTSGLASRKQVAELFELDDIYVGEAWHNTAKKGKAVETSRLWGNHFSLHYRRKMVTGDDTTPSHGTTASWRGRRVHIVNATPGTVGIDGGARVVVGESLKELTLDKKCGYIFKNIVAVA